TYRIFGVKPDGEPSYTDFLAAIHPEDRAAVEDAVRAALERRAPYALDHRIVLPDGSERIVHEQAEVRYGPDGNPAEMVGIVQDVTDR
ncbi:PAS domain-containing protein, partial [Halomonas sp. SIMBA_159]